MTFQIKPLRAAFAAAIALAASLGSAEAREMRVSSFEPAPGFFSQTLQAWIDEVNPQLSDSNQFKLYPGGILGSPPAQAELVAAGVADVAFVVPTYSAGVYPMTSVVEIPGIASDAATGTAVLNGLMDEGLLGDEFSEYKIIALFSTPGYRIFTSGEGAASADDLAGLKMRSPSPFGSALLDSLGAAGVPMPAPQVYENIERNVVSGAAWTMDAYRTFRLYEVAPNVTETRFIASPLVFLMNMNTYNSLPDADKAVIDAMSLSQRSAWVAERIDTGEATIEAEMRAAGEVNFISLDDQATADWNAALAGASDLWLSDKPEAAVAVLDRARELSGE
jgi:TRAP-type C4-dicarboxylate transport system substrate-binding protein